MDILFEDNHVLVAFKPAGLLTQDSGTGRDNLEQQLRDFLKKRDHKPGNAFLHALHRLDTPAWGLVVFAKSRKALSRLNEGLRSGRFHKEYQALVTGKRLPPKGELRHFLRHGDKRAHVFAEPRTGAKEARLSYEKLSERSQGDLLRVELRTGRYHQIRAQLAYMGCPILGDHLYGGTPWEHEGIALCHVKVAFPHPVQGVETVVQVSLAQLEEGFGHGRSQGRVSGSR